MADEAREKLLEQLEDLRRMLDREDKSNSDRPTAPNPTHARIKSKIPSLHPEEISSTSIPRRVISVSLWLPNKEENFPGNVIPSPGFPPKALHALESVSSFNMVHVGCLYRQSNNNHHQFPFVQRQQEQQQQQKNSNLQSYYNPYFHNEHENDPSRGLTLSQSFEVFPSAKLEIPSMDGSSFHSSSGLIQKQDRVIVVELPPEETMMHYLSFCEDILRGVLFYDYAALGEEDNEQKWNAYRYVNSKFTDVITEIYQEGDLIWVHDYHFMILPATLRVRRRNAKIGFFLYTPFPAFELFRLLPWRTELLKGALGSDLIGFYSFDYSKQFIASCAHLLGVETNLKYIEVERGGRTCEVGIFTSGIEVSLLQSFLNDSTVQARVAGLKKRFEGRKIIIGIERLDDLYGGIPNKLVAYDEFLTTCPEWKEKVVFLQVALISSNPRNVASYRALTQQVNSLVGDINSKHGTLTFAPVHSINMELKQEDFYAFLSLGDVCIISCIRDGFNLIPFSWTVCQKDGNHGVLILSEFAGPAFSFSTALHVNPWDIDQLSAAIKSALTMSSGKKKQSCEIAYRFVSQHTAKLFCFNFLEDLNGIEENKDVKPPLRFIDPNHLQYWYNQCKSQRLIILDYDGTMVPFIALQQLSAPPPYLLETLRQLVSDSKNVVFIITTRSREIASSWFESLEDVSFGLICEDGCFVKYPGESEWDSAIDDWMAMIRRENYKTIIAPVMMHYTDRTPGSILEEGEVTVTWHYSDADKDFGRWQSRELQLNLGPSLQHFRLEVQVSDKWVRVYPAGISKCSILNGIFERYAKSSEVIICFGDDVSDDDMFKSLRDEIKLQSYGFEGRVFTISVGGNSSTAEFVISNPDHVCTILHDLSLH